MARLTRAYDQRGVGIWAVLASPYGKNYDASGQTDLTLATRQDLNWYARRFNVHYSQLVDRTFQTVNEYGARYYPTIYVVDGKGIIRYAASGHQAYTTLAKPLDRVLPAAGAS